MKFSVLFWNVWFENQINGPKSSKKILDELTRLVEKYQPDCIGLNEVLQHVDTTSPFVLDHLKTLGYKYSYFAPSSPIRADWLIGSAVCSKIKLEDTEDIILGEDVPATQRGIPGQTHKSIAAKVRLSQDVAVGLIVAHLVHLRSHTLKAHYKEQWALDKFMHHSGYGKMTLVGGDFNEPRWFPRSFKHLTKSFLHHKTGSLRNHTWQHKASGKTIVRANLDRLFWTRDSRMELADFGIIPSSASDHKPIFAVFDINVMIS